MALSVPMRRPLAPGADLGLLIRAILVAAAVAGIAVPVGLLEPEYLAVFALGAPVVILALLRPAAMLPLLLFSVPFGDDFKIGNEKTFFISPTEILVALMALGWIGQCVRSHRCVLRGGAILGFALATTGLMLFSTTYAESIGAAIKESLKWAEFVVVFLVVADRIRDARKVAFLVATLGVAASLEAGWGIVQFALGAGPTFFQQGGALRAYGNFDQPNPFAGYLATVLPLAAVVALRGAPRGTWSWYRWVAAGVACATAAGILLSQSRGAWLGVAVAGVVLLLSWNRRTRSLLVPVSAVVIFVTLLALLGALPSFLENRLVSTVENFGIFDVRTVNVTADNWALVERMAHWQAGWLMFLDHPWLGVGAGNYSTAYPNYFLTQWVDPLGHAHNWYLNMLAELGVVGLTLQMGFVLAMLRALASAIRRATQVPGDAPEVFWKAVLVGTLGSFVAFLTHNMFDNLFVHSVNVQIGLLLGLGAVAADQLARAQGRSISAGMGQASLLPSH